MVFAFFSVHVGARRSGTIIRYFYIFPAFPRNYDWSAGHGVVRKLTCFTSINKTVMRQFGLLWLIIGTRAADGACRFGFVCTENRVFTYATDVRRLLALNYRNTIVKCVSTQTIAKYSIAIITVQGIRHPVVFVKCIGNRNLTAP